MSILKDKDLAIAFSVRRKAKKKMAAGGPVSASSEKRPMPEMKANDAKEVMMNSHEKALKQADMLSEPDRIQTRKGLKQTKIKHPSMVPSSVFTARLRTEEDDLMDSAHPASDKEQPPRHDNEEGPDRQGPMSKDLKLKMMAEGGKINRLVPMEESEEDMAQHPAHLEDDEDMMAPSEEEIMSSHFAKGGMAHEMDMQPEDEEHDEHASSVAAAVMAKRKKYAKGGHINGMDAAESDDSDMAHLERNAEEDLNLEDQMSFDALRKENYSESEGLDELDRPHDENLHGDPREMDEENDHDKSLVGRIRSKMKRRSPITE